MHVKNRSSSSVKLLPKQGLLELYELRKKEKIKIIKVSGTV